MTPPPKCCNPFKRKNHNCFRNNLVYLSKRCDKKFSALFGFYICSSCKTQLYKSKNCIQFEKVDETTRKETEHDAKEINVESEEDEKMETKSDEEYVCPSVNNEIKKMKLAATFDKVLTASFSEKSQFNLSEVDSEMFRKTICGHASSLFSDPHRNDWINDFKISFSRASTREQKIFLLTTIPVKWSIRKTAKEFGVSKRMIISSKKLQNEKGYGSYPDKKKGRAMSTDHIEKVKEFFLSDNVSRVMPGVKDYKSIIVNGKRQHETVTTNYVK